MTSSFSKRKWAGEPVKDQRKVVPEPPRHPSKSKPREYVLLTRKHVSYYMEHESKYPTKTARDQARADAIKKNRGSGSLFKWYKNYKSDVTFEEWEK